MDREIIVIDCLNNPEAVYTEAKKIIDLRASGYVFDPEMYVSGGVAKPLAVPGVGAIYHLVKFNAEDVKAMEAAKKLEAEKVLQAFHNKPRVIDSQDVSTKEGRGDVNALLAKGYRIENEWSTHSLLYLYEGEEIIKGDHIDDATKIAQEQKTNA